MRVKRCAPSSWRHGCPRKEPLHSHRRSGRDREIRPRLADGGVPERLVEPVQAEDRKDALRDAGCTFSPRRPAGFLYKAAPLQGGATGSGEDSSRLPGRILPTPPVFRPWRGRALPPHHVRGKFTGRRGDSPKVQATGLAGRCRRLSADALLAEIRRSEEAPSRAGRRPRPTRWGRGPPRPAPR